jgi:hypothetical protein
MAHVFLPPSMNADAKSLLKCTMSSALFNATIRSTSSAEYSTDLSTLTISSGPLSLSQTYGSTVSVPLA